MGREDAEIRLQDTDQIIRVPLSREQRTAPRKRGKQPVRVLPRADVQANGSNGVANMDELVHLHEASILDNIRVRFAQDIIYTATGPILIAMNPYKWLPIYQADSVARYHNSENLDVEEPHCFAVAEKTHRLLKATKDSASIIICGESGAGKTETTKLMLGYISSIASRSAHDQIAERIMISNPLMEAFGNAKTSRNNNSR